MIAICQLQAFGVLGWSYTSRTFKNVPTVQNQHSHLQQPDKGSYNGTTEFHKAVPNCVKECSKRAHTVCYDMLQIVIGNFLF